MSDTVAAKRLNRLKKTLDYNNENFTNKKVYRTELTPYHFLSRSALVYPNKTAIIYKDVNYNYYELNRRVLKLAYILKTQFDIQEGDKVGLLMRNVPFMFEAHFALPALRAVIVAINTRLNRGDVEYIVEHSKCKLVLVEQTFLPLVSNLKSAKIVEVKDHFSLKSQDKGSATLDSLMDSLPLNLNLESLTINESGDEEDVIAIGYTSGTTGRPKGVMTTYRGATLAAVSNVMATGMSKDSSYLWILPLFHCNGWCFPWATVAVGACNVLLEKVDGDLIWDILTNHKVTHFCAAPTVQIMLSHHKAAHPLQHEVLTMIAGSSPSPALIAKLETLNIKPLHAYGLTETYGPCTLSEQDVTFDDLDKPSQARLMARQGFSYPLADKVRVVDADMKDVPADGKSVGEVVFRGNMVMKGYYDDLEATNKAFHGGYFHTGDLAYVNQNGAISLVDRSKDIIISGGENISTIEVENALADHHAVLELAVIPAPHSKWGETPMAFVVLDPHFQFKGDEAVLEKELITFSKTKLTAFKCPTKVQFVKELPKTGTGKVQKYILRQKLWKSFSKQHN